MTKTKFTMFIGLFLAIGAQFVNADPFYFPNEMGNEVYSTCTIRYVDPYIISSIRLADTEINCEGKTSQWRLHYTSTERFQDELASALAGSLITHICYPPEYPSWGKSTVTCTITPNGNLLAPLEYTVMSSASTLMPSWTKIIKAIKALVL